MFGFKKVKKNNEINEIKKINMNLQSINTQYDNLNKSLIDFTKAITEVKVN